MSDRKLCCKCYESLAGQVVRTTADGAALCVPCFRLLVAEGEIPNPVLAGLHTLSDGWRVFGTGGGCEAYRLDLGDGRYILMTEASDPSITVDVDDPIGLCLYDGSKPDDPKLPWPIRLDKYRRTFNDGVTVYPFEDGEDVDCKNLDTALRVLAASFPALGAGWGWGEETHTTETEVVDAVQEFLYGKLEEGCDTVTDAAGNSYLIRVEVTLIPNGKAEPKDDGEEGPEDEEEEEAQ